MRRIVTFVVLLIGVIVSCNAQLQSGTYTYQYVKSIDSNGNRIDNGYSWKTLDLVVLNMNLGFGIGKTLGYQQRTGYVQSPWMQDFDFAGYSDGFMVYCQQNIYIGNSYVFISSDTDTVILKNAFDGGISHIYQR